MSRAGLALDDLGLVHRSPPTPIPGRLRSVDDVVVDGARRHPGREALVGDNGRYTYRELEAEVGRVAAFLAGLGVRPGDRVAACLPNRPDIVVAFLATMRLGALWVGVNGRLASPEKAYQLRDAGAAALLAAPDTIAALGDELPASMRHVVEVPAGEPACAWAGEVHDIRGGEHLDPFAPAAIAYTSGTTGRPKGAVHSQHNLVLVGAVNAAFRLWRRDRRQGAVLALTMLNVMALCPLLAFQLGGTCVCVERSDPVNLAMAIQREKIQSFSAVPPMVADLLTHVDVEASRLSSLTNVGVGGQRCPDELRVAYHEMTGFHLCPSYGLTEAPTALTTQTPGSSAPPGSTGRALPHLEVLITDHHGQTLGPGEVGEICARALRSGPWAGVYTPFLGYWHQPEATSEALSEGLLHTGDLGSLDEQGHLFLKDRLNELIIRGGANVYPAEVERVLAARDEVAEAVVVGVPDRRLGERVVAYVELASSGRTSRSTVDQHQVAETLRSACATELARYKVPEEFRFLERLPRNAMGKVLRTALRAPRSVDGSPEGC